MTRPRAMLYTKRQLLHLMGVWGTDAALPPKGKKLLVCFPTSLDELEDDLAEVESTPLKSDAGLKLWRVTTSSRAGRAFEDCVQESHVVAYRLERVERQPQINLSRNQQLLQQAAP